MESITFVVPSTDLGSENCQGAGWWEWVERILYEDNRIHILALAISHYVRFPNFTEL